MHGRIAVNAAAAAVTPALPKANEAPQEAPLRIGVVLEGLENSLDEATIRAYDHASRGTAATGGPRNALEPLAQRDIGRD